METKTPETVAAALRAADRRARKALTDLAGEAAILFSKLQNSREIDADAAGRLLHGYASDATANLALIEAFRVVRESASEGGNDKPKS
jgi:hypothetical protein